MFRGESRLDHRAGRRTENSVFRRTSAAPTRRARIATTYGPAALSAASSCPSVVTSEDQPHRRDPHNGQRTPPSARKQCALLRVPSYHTAGGSSGSSTPLPGGTATGTSRQSGKRPAKGADSQLPELRRASQMGAGPWTEIVLWWCWASGVGADSGCHWRAIVPDAEHLGATSIVASHLSRP